MLQLRLLGQFDLHLAGASILLPSRAAQSLLAFLSLHPAVPHRREQLAGLLWPDALDANARGYLRKELWRIRKALGPDLLLTDDIAVTFNPRAAHWLDVNVLTSVDADGPLDVLSAGLDLYRGELLPGFYDEWIVLERQHLLSVFEHKVQRLVSRLLAANHLAEARAWSERWIALGTSPEAAYRALMVAYARDGDLGRVSHTYHRCVTTLHDDLGVEPSEQTYVLYERLRRGELPVTDGLRPPARPLPVPAIHSDADEPPAPGDPPFKGLAYFDVSDAGIFFGREATSARLVERVHQERFLAVVGASGSGKSSLVRAGLVAALRNLTQSTDGAVPGAPTWRVHILTPTAHPLEALALALTRGAHSPTATTRLIDELRLDPRALHFAVAARSDSAERLLLVVDQLEELFTLCHSAADRRAFIDSLMTAVGPDVNAILHVVATLRADFYAHCAHYPALGDALAHRQEFIGPLDAAELRRAIEAPAQAGGWTLDAGLVDLILRDVGREPGALPLLSHALLETWHRRRGRHLTLKGYAETGTIQGAIARTADTLYHHRLDPTQQALARRILLRLTEPGEGQPDTRRRATRSELAPDPADGPAVTRVLNILAAARLITLDADTVEVAHEALIREWPTLRQWLDASRADLRLARQLAAAASDWTASDRDPSFLATGIRLAQFESLAAHPDIPLTTDARAYLDASLAEHNRQTQAEHARQARELDIAQRAAAAARLAAGAAEQAAAAERRQADSERRRAEEQTRAAAALQRRSLYLFGAFMVAAVLAVAAIFFGQQSAANARRADEQRVEADRQRAAAERSQADADTQRLVALGQRDAAARAESEAVAHRDRAEQARADAELQRQTAFARELSVNAVANLTVDPERSILLALHAIAVSTTGGRPVHREAEEALHRAVHSSRVVRTLRGHTAGVYGVAFTADGQRVATASFDHTARVWDLSTGATLATLVGHAAELRDLAFSPDGTRVVTASYDKTAIIWDAATGRPALTLAGHTDAVWDAAFSPDGTRVATAGQDRSVRLWDAVTGRLLHTFAGHTAIVRTVAFSPDGLRLVSASEDRSARIWDIASGAELAVLTGHGTGVWDATFSPDGARIATAGGVDDTTRLWDAATGGLLRTFPPTAASKNAVAFDATGFRLLVGRGDGAAMLLDVATGQTLLELRGHSGPIPNVTFAAPGILAVTAGGDSTARVWNLGPSGGEEWPTLIGHAARIRDLAITHDGAYFLTAGADKTARLWNAATGRHLVTLSGHTNELRGIAVSPNGARAATIGDDQTTRLWDTATGALLHTAVTGADALGNTSHSVAFSPDGQLWATEFKDHAVQIWNVDTGQPVLSLVGHSGPVRGIAFSPDGRRLATTSDDKTGRVWDLATGQTLLTLSGHTNRLYGVAYSLDGTLIATGSADGTARLWNAADGRLLHTLSGHTGNVFAVTFSPDGHRLATTSNDGTVRLWNIRPDSRVDDEPFTFHSTGNHFRAVFSPDGRRLAFTARPDVVRVIALSLEDIVAIAKSRVTRSLTTDECQKFLHTPTCP